MGRLKYGFGIRHDIIMAGYVRIVISIAVASLIKFVQSFDKTS